MQDVSPFYRVPEGAVAEAVADWWIGQNAKLKTMLLPLGN